MSGLVQLTGKQVRDHSLEMADLPLSPNPGEILISVETNGENVYTPKKHSDLDASDGIHKLHAFNFSTLEERDAFLPIAADIGKMCRVGNYFYLLSTVDPVVWSSFGTQYIELNAGGASTEYNLDTVIDGGQA